MARWEPDARGRLEQAALDLFEEHGYDRTSVEDIATRAGLTKRTFFRHFADKREVLFGGGDAFQQRFLDALAAAPASATPFHAVAETLEAIGATFTDRADFARRRHRVIAANAELRERELVKLAAVAAAVAGALRERGVTEPAASIAAETGMAIFRTAFERWAVADDQELPDVLRDSLETLRDMAAAG